MNTLQLFEFPDFKGESVSLKGDNPDLSTVGFLKKAQSLKVQGDPWIVFSDVKYDYRGTFKCFSEGDYNSISGWAKKISSARIVRGGLSKPKISVYENNKYGGNSAFLEKAANSLKAYGINNFASSLQCQSGAWILYSEENTHGDQMVAVAGDKIPDCQECPWQHRVGSLKPITPDE